jgi:TonB family protein
VPRDQLGIQPTFTPFTLAPELTNRDEITGALKAAYPAMLRTAGIGGKTLTWIFIDENGRVRTTQVKVTSGYEPLDSAALHVARQMRFRPAMNRDQVVPVWVEIPIVFTTDGAAGDKTEQQAKEPLLSRVEVPGAGANAQSGAAARNAAAGVSLEQRELTNADEVTRALVRNYPPLLRDAGIGGKVELYLYVDEAGLVQRTTVLKTSGYDALDQAALQVSTLMRFVKASHAGWVALPLTFSAN